MSHNYGYYFSFINFYYKEFSPRLLQNPPLGGTSLSMFNEIYNQQDYCKKNILLMDIYNLVRCSIYNDQLIEKQTNIT